MLDLNKTQDAHVNERLEKESIIWLSSMRPDGRPHLVPVWFVWQNGGVLIFSENNQKIRNLRQNPAVTLALEARDEGGDIVLFEGQAELTGEDILHLPELDAYKQKYGEQMKAMNMPIETMAQNYSNVIRIKPTKFISWS